VQLRRVLLLFALVLGLSALVASIVPPPETREERETGPSMPAAARAPAPPTLSFGAASDGAETRRAAVGSRLTVVVSVPAPGEVTVEGLGLRASADPRAPARFDLVARRSGRHAVVFLPPGEPPSTVGRIVFANAATVRPRAPGG
jgi:hypothetical protein